MATRDGSDTDMGNRLNRRLLISSALAALLTPTLGLAQGQGHGRPGEGRPPGGGHPAHGGSSRPPVPNGPYRPGGGRPPNFRPVPGPRWRYPPGYHYRRWNPGFILPSIFLSPAYFYDDYWRMGLAGPPYGYRWVRYGPDLLLVEIRTGRIVDVIYGAFY